jgi:hypothetical protein
MAWGVCGNVDGRIHQIRSGIYSLIITTGVGLLVDANSTSVQFQGLQIARNVSRSRLRRPAIDRSGKGQVRCNVGFIALEAGHNSNR